MCGIAGVLYADRARLPEQSLLEGMARAIAHRGPDGQGALCEPGVGLVHRRLAIIDLVGGAQPIGNEDGQVQVVFNGEIYNYAELRRELLARGHQFRTNSDTEVIVHLYEELGEKLVERLRGMFAFALWDRRRRWLLLARDRLGIKPLYWYRDANRLLFGSELKAILACRDVPRAVDPAALEDYLAYGVVPGAQTIFRGIAKLPPGHTLTVCADDWQAAPRRYWQLHFEPNEQATLDEWHEAVRAKITEAVRLHLVADVPVGAFLSGGLDSSLIVAEASALMSEPVQTFSIGFHEESFSELPHARAIAQRFGTRHHEEIVTADAGILLDELVHHYDEPFADSSALPTFLVSRLASRFVKVVLSGDGGDEAFGGYARYAHDLREDAVRRCLPGVLRRGLLGPLGRMWPKADWLPRPLRAKTTLTNLALDPADAYANTLALCRPPLRRRLLNRDVAQSLNGHRSERQVRDGFLSAPAGDTLSGMLAADVGMLLPDDYLVKVDRASMAHGLEVRPPLLDHELLELLARVPSRYKIKGGQTKWLMRHVCRDLLPADTLTRRKQGFEVPIDAWLRGPLRARFADTVLRPAAPAAQLLDLDVLRRMQTAHLQGTSRNGAILWSALVLARWADEYLPA